MKRSTFIYTLLSGILVCAPCCYLVMFPDQYGKEHGPSPVSAITAQAPLVIKPLRERITFILGEDREADNRYYAEAENYFANNAAARTEYLVTSCRSLLEVRDYLEKYKPCNGLPWGIVNLVTHGNPWTGLSVRVAPWIKRTTVEKLEECLADGTWKPLPMTLMDEETEIILHGCGVGNNPCLVDALALVFGGRYHQPVVRASRFFESYASVVSRGKLETRHYLAATWMASYEMGERPADSTLVATLREAYPRAGVDWGGALSRQQPRWIGDSYHYTFEIPVKWILRLSHDSIPSEAAQLAWIARHREVTKELDALQIPYGKFNWSFAKVYTDNDDGSKSQAIWLKGYCTMLTVLQALTSADNSNGALNTPFEPAFSDSEYYYTSAHPLDTGTDVLLKPSLAWYEL